ncbi:efflux RND transporter permease subunit, partial [bacterium]|nr:efflux RND transporter permease subunit [bacterium]
EEDQGYLFVGNIMPDAASMERTTAVSDQAVKLLQTNKAMADITQIDGYSLIDGSVKDNAGLLFASLKPYNEREGKGSDAFSVQKDLGRKLYSIKE